MLTAPRFVVSVNGRQRCVAGFDGYAVLSAGIVFVRSAERECMPLIDGVARFTVGGGNGREHVHWLNEDLFVGDEVNIRILDGGPVDPRTRGVGPTLESRRERLAAIDNAIPHRFEVLGNGERICMAGLEFGVLSMNLVWVRREPAAHPPHSSESAEQWEGGDVSLRVGGLHNDVHLEWCRVHVDVGDEIAVRILGPGPSDPPQRHEERVRIPHEEEILASGPHRILRRLVDDDLPFVTKLLGNAGAVAHFQAPLSAEEATHWLARHREYQQRYRGIWLIIEKETRNPVGLAGVIDMTVEDKRMPVVQCVIDPANRRKGHGIDAAWMCFGLVHKPPPWGGLASSDLYALVQPENEAGIALANRLRMTPLRPVQHDGRDHILFIAEVRGR